MTEPPSRQRSQDAPRQEPDPSRTPELCDDIDLRIARNGTWFYQGSPIGRKSLVKLFATVLRREDDGEYYLVTPVEKCRVVVDDAPFLAVEMDVEGGGRSQTLTFRTNLDDLVVADGSHPIRVRHDPDTGEPSPYVLVRDGLEALIARSVYYDLVERGVEENVDGDYLFGVWSDGTFFRLGRLDR